MRLVLEVRPGQTMPINVGTIDPIKITGLTTKEVENFRLDGAGIPTYIGDLFSVKCTELDQDEVIFTGDTELLWYAGREMTGGRLVIDGNAGSCAGMAMQGGTLRINGNAGDWCGGNLPGESKGMTGGTILVKGTCGREVGAGMRRGLIAIGGNCGAGAAAHMHAGTLLCMGKLGRYAGVGMRRGSIVASRSEPLLPGFVPGDLVDIGWLRIYVNRLRKLSYPVPEEWLNTQPHRYTGDHLKLGKGEINIYDLAE